MAAARDAAEGTPAPSANCVEGQFASGMLSLATYSTHTPDRVWVSCAQYAVGRACWQSRSQWTETTPTAARAPA